MLPAGGSSVSHGVGSGKYLGEAAGAAFALLPGMTKDPPILASEAAKATQRGWGEVGGGGGHEPLTSHASVRRDVPRSRSETL